MRQVFWNLLSNAVKFSSRRSDARIEVRATESGSEWVFHVRDNGAGFDPVHADGLFGVFRRLHGELEFEGTGVGLAIVKRVVEWHGGRVWAQATDGQGATFFFTLPANRIVRHD